MYLLYYDIDAGNREDWNIFYTPVEVYSTKEKREERIKYIKTKMGEAELKKIDFDFYTVDVESIDIPVDSDLSGSWDFEELQEYVDEQTEI